MILIPLAASIIKQANLLQDSLDQSNNSFVMPGQYPDTYFLQTMDSSSDYSTQVTDDDLDHIFYTKLSQSNTNIDSDFYKSLSNGPNTEIGSMWEV
jgi:hypothetical protein